MFLKVGDLLPRRNREVTTGEGMRQAYEVGDDRDNLEVFLLGVYTQAEGDHQGARRILLQLREHILKTQDNKSVAWLLAHVEAVLHGDSRDDRAAVCVWD
jgi:hypothetical protein